MRRAGAAALLVTLAACAADTPQQRLAYARWQGCGAAFVRLERIDLDGRITFLYGDSAERQRVLQCLAEAGREGPPLPAPQGVRPPGGP